MSLDEMPARLLRWCSLCSSKPSDGVAKVIDEAEQEVDLDLCVGCYRIIKDGPGR